MRNFLFFGQILVYILLVNNINAQTKTTNNKGIEQLSAINEKVLEFNGTDQYINCGNNSSLQITGSSFTIETWIYPTNFKTAVWENSIVDHHFVGYVGYGMQFGGNGQFDFDFGDGNSWHNLTSPENALQLNRWQHIAGVYDGSSIKLYVNGNLIAEKTDTASMVPNTSTDLYLCEGNTFSGRFFTGKLDEIRIWKSGKTQAEIQQSMADEISTSDTNLVLYYKFSNFSNNIETDISANSNNGTLINMTDTNYLKGYSMVFPQNLALSLGSNSIIASWDESITGTTDSFYIEVATDKNFIHKINGYNPYYNCGDTLTKTISNLDLGTKYFIRVRCENDSFGDVGAQFVCDSIIVEDITPPQTQLLPDINAECSAIATIPTTTDDYAGVIYGTTNDPTEYYTQGIHTIIWNFDDGNGNSIDIPQKVVIEDITEPEIHCREDVHVLINNVNQTYYIQGNELDLQSCNDNCSIKYITNDYNNRNTLSGSTFNIGNTTILWTVADSVNNISQCIFNINIETTLNINETKNNNDFLIYPNPCNGKFVLNTSLTKKIEKKYIIKLYNIKGEIVFSTPISSYTQNIDVKHLDKGIYILEIESKSYISKKRLIIY